MNGRKVLLLLKENSMLAGLREAKLSRNKKIKVRFFPGAKSQDSEYHLIPYLKKSSIILSSISVLMTVRTNLMIYYTNNFWMSNKSCINTIQIAKISSRHLLLFEQINKRQITYLKSIIASWNRKQKSSNITPSHLAYT